MALIKSKFPVFTNLTDFFDDDWLKSRFTNGDLIPAVNVIDNDSNYEIEMAAPGFKKEDFNVTVDNGVLSISAKSEKEEEETKKNYTRKEFSSKSFLKSFTLPKNAREEVTAKYEDGVLRLFVLKTAHEKPPKKEVVIE